MIEPFKGLALGVFLITVGMSVDLAALVARLGSIVLAVVAVLRGQGTASPALLLRLMGARPAIATETGILMASPSETTLDRARRGRAPRLIQPETAQFWQIVTAIGLTVTPLAGAGWAVLARRVEPAQVIAPTTIADGAARLIVGCGRVGRLVAEMLDAHGRPYVAIDSDADMVRAVQARRAITRCSATPRGSTCSNASALAARRRWC